MQEMFTDESMNWILCNAGIWPLTTSRDDYPAMGMVTDWNPATSDIYAVAEIPVIFAHCN